MCKETARDVPTGIEPSEPVAIPTFSLSSPQVGLESPPAESQSARSVGFAAAPISHDSSLRRLDLQFAAALSLVIL